MVACEMCNEGGVDPNCYCQAEKRAALVPKLVEALKSADFLLLLLPVRDGYEETARLEVRQRIQDVLSEVEK